MTATNYLLENVSTYPGAFTPPLYNWDEVMKEIHRPQEGSKSPSANVSECADHYKIEIAAPGHSNEDFIVGIENNKLSVVVMQTKLADKTENFRQHEFNFNWFSHTIELPETIDADFVSAEYRAGILSMCFPKVTAPTVNTVHRIVVY